MLRQHGRDRLNTCQLFFPGRDSQARQVPRISPRCEGDSERISRPPPDFVVEFQPIDIVDVILWRIFPPHVVYQREIKG